MSDQSLLSLTSWKSEPEPALGEGIPPPPPQPGSGANDSAADDEDQNYRLHRRFDRLGRLFGDGVVQHLMAQRVVVFGLGGVGSFAAEALARSAIGHLMVVDFDKVCITNTNRQLQAMAHTVGRSKADLTAERLRAVNSQAKIEARSAFYSIDNSEEMMTPPWSGPTDQWDFVVDCVDNMTAKAHLLAECKKRGVPVISSMGAAGKIDPTRIRISDLAETKVCRMAKDMRKIMRKKHDFPGSGPMGIKAVWSDEDRLWPRELNYDGGQGFRCVCPHRSSDHGCDERQLIDGTVAFVTGSFGLTCASVVINTLTEGMVRREPPAVALRGTLSREERSGS